MGCGEKVTVRIRTQFVMPAGDHPLAIGKAGGHDGQVTDGRTGLNRLCLHGVVRPHHPGKQAIGAALDGDTGNDERVLADLQQQPRIDELSRP